MQPAESGAITGVWVHSHEEDGPQGQVFRPSGYPFPPARGRTKLELQPQGQAIEQRPGADDRPIAHDAGWSVSDDGYLTVISGSSTRRYKIISASPDQLVLKKES